MIKRHRKMMEAVLVIMDSIFIRQKHIKWKILVIVKMDTLLNLEFVKNDRRKVAQIPMHQIMKKMQKRIIKNAPVLMKILILMNIRLAGIIVKID